MRDQARRIAANIAKLPELVHQIYVRFTESGVELTKRRR
jgi:hypothetical protein